MTYAYCLKQRPETAWDLAAPKPERDRYRYAKLDILARLSLVHSTWRPIAQAIMVKDLDLESGAVITKLLAGGVLSRVTPNSVEVTSGQRTKVSATDSKFVARRC